MGNDLYDLDEVRRVREWHIEFRGNLLANQRFTEAIIESLTIAMLADLITMMEQQ